MTAPVGTAALVHGIEDRVGWARTVLLGAQHVMVMFTAMVGSPLVVARGLGLSPAPTAAMISGCMLGCGVGTMLASLARAPAGARLPLVLGVFAVFIGPVSGIARASGLAAAAAALLVGSAFTLLASPVLARSRALLPPVVLGSVLLVTGASLLRVAAGLLLDGPPAGVGLGLLTVALIVALGTLRGALRPYAVFVALVAGYALAGLSGLVDFSALAASPFFAVPDPLPFGLAWPPVPAVATVVACCLAASVETAVQAISVASICGVPIDRRRVGGAIAADGAGSVCSVLFGGLPLTSYSQNIGAITLTGVGSRFVVAACGAMLAALSCFPRVSLVLALTPPPVLGGVLLFMFGIIATVGITAAGTVAAQRDRTIVAVALASGLGAAFSGPALSAMLPPFWRPFLADGIIVGMLAAVLLNLVLPKD